MDLVETRISVPRPGKDSLVLDLAPVYRTEARVQEIATVTPQKAPELLMIFNVAFLDLSRMSTALEMELLQAKKLTERARAIAILDKVPGILKEKNLVSPRSPSGSEDQRNAILALDEEYQQATENEQQVACVLQLIKGKLKGIEMAYMSVKKILGENSFNYNQNLGGGHSDSTSTGFGTPRYGG